MECVSHTGYSKLKREADERNGKNCKESGRKERGRAEEKSQTSRN